jgi:hypothetical protein
MPYKMSQGDDWVEQLTIQISAIGGHGNQLFFMLKELGLGLKSMDLTEVELAK